MSVSLKNDSIRTVTSNNKLHTKITKHGTLKPFTILPHHDTWLV